MAKKLHSDTIAIMPVHGRHDTVSRVLPYYADMGIHVIAVCSAYDMGFLSNYEHVTAIETYNHFPNKINTGIAHALILPDWEYLLMVGSDDFISDLLIQDFKNELGFGFDMVSISNCYFYDTETDYSFYWPGYPPQHHRHGEPAGAWRIYRRSLMETIGATMYDCEERAMDMHAWQLARAHGTVSVLNEFKYIHAIDIKDKHSITSVYAFNYLQSPPPLLQEEIRRIVNMHTASYMSDSSSLPTEGEGGQDL